ncbi:MAG: hypothetical protein K6A82_00395 [Prevotella sp.]|nr:hypothetical protein [Prevotella sp.]
MKKILSLMALVALCVFSSCRDDDPVVPDDQPDMADNTVFVYMPWSGDSGNLYGFFQDNLEDIRKAIVAQGGLGNTDLLVFTSTAATRGVLMKVEYKGGACVNDTLASFNNAVMGRALNSAGWITYLLNQVEQAAPARSFSMIIGCHGKGWIPASADTEPVSYAKSMGMVRPSGPVTRWFGGETYKTDIATLARGISQSRIGRMQYVLFDDCNMANIETAYELRGCTRYMVSCPTEIMGYGMPYEHLWKELSSQEPDYARVCDEFISFYTNYTYNGYPYPYGTISVIDCSQTERMAQVMREINRSGALPAVPEDNLQSMDGYSPSIFFDMGDYVEQMAKGHPQLLERFRQQLRLLVPYKGNTASYYTNIDGRSVCPIRTYSGITISDPSVNLDIADALKATSYYVATH